MRIRQSLAAALFVLAGCGGALAADPSGTWLTQGGNSRIKIADCGGALCGTIIQSGASVIGFLLFLIAGEKPSPATPRAVRNKSLSRRGKRAGSHAVLRKHSVAFWRQ